MKRRKVRTVTCQRCGRRKPTWRMSRLSGDWLCLMCIGIHETAGEIIVVNRAA